MAGKADVGSEKRQWLNGCPEIGGRKGRAESHDFVDLLSHQNHGSVSGELEDIQPISFILGNVYVTCSYVIRDVGEKAKWSQYQPQLARRSDSGFLLPFPIFNLNSRVKSRSKTM
jgi:hypothetical protein